MASVKNKMFDEAEAILDQYSWYVANRILTFNEAVEILCNSKKVVSFFDKAEIEAIMSFELQKGHTVQ